MALTEADVKTYYQAILQREPTDAQLAVAMATGTADSLIHALIGSNEAQSFVFPLIQVYQAVFGRVPDAAGLDFWVDAYRDGTSLEDITAGFVASDEFQNKYGGVTDGSDPAFINALYLNVLGRPGEPAGIAFWTSQTGISPAEVIRLFAIDTEFTNKAAGPISDFLTDAANGVADAYVGSLFGDGTIDHTEVLTTGLDNFAGTAGNDLILGLVDGTGDTLTLGDRIDGGEGIDTLNVTFNNTTSHELNLGVATISNVEKLYVKNADSDFATLNVNNNAFQEVTIDYAGTTQGDDLYINNIRGQTSLIIENVVADGYTFYRNGSGKFDATAGAVSVSNTIRNIDVQSSPGDIDFEGYEYFTNATEINHTLNVENIVSDGSYYLDAYEYIKTKVDGAVINSTVNLTNVKAATSYGDIYIYADNEASQTVDMNMVWNLKDVDNYYLYTDTYYSGDDDENDVITYNLDNVQNADGDMMLDSSGFDEINVNVLSDSEIEYLYDGGSSADVDQTLTIVAAADLTVANYTQLNGDGNISVTVSGEGNVDLGDFYAGDGDATDTVAIDATGLTGDFSVYDVNGYAASINTGSGNDVVKLGGVKTVVNTGSGDDIVDINGGDFSTAGSKAIDGGSGRNTIVINDGALLDADLAAKISNFQILDVSGAAGGDTYDMSVESSLDSVVATGALGAVTIDKAAAGTTVSLRSAASSNSTVTSLNYALATATGTNDNLSLSLTAWDTDTKANDKDGQLTVSAVTADDIETFSISSNAVTTDGSVDGKTLFTAADYTNTISSLAGDAVKTVTLTGAANLTITDVTAGTLTKVDASAMTGSLSITLDGSANTAAVAVLGGSAGDTIVLTGNTAANNIIQGNGGGDIITLATAGTKETVRYASDGDSVLTGTDTTTPADNVWDKVDGFDTITNFTSGEDKIELSSVLGLGTGDARSAITGKGVIGDGGIADNAELAGILQTLIGDGLGFFNDGTTDRAVAQVIIDDVTDSTMLFIDVDADGNFTNGVDNAIHLVGNTTGLVISDIVFG